MLIMFSVVLVCLFVSNITQKVMNEFQWNCMEDQGWQNEQLSD